MTFGQLFTIMHPDVKVVGNGTCMWLFLDEVNHYTIATEWWNQEIHDSVVELLKEQEPKSPCTDCQEFVCDGCKYLSKKPSDSGDGYEPPEGACAI